MAALKKAAATGAWDDVLDKVADHRLSYAVDAQALFNKRSGSWRRGLVTAVACPFRNVESYPPITLANVEESDLQAQWEQIGMPYHGPFSVDFYKRPGKKAWGHPEVWNDAGTGDQVLTTLWQMVMRGADGVGCSDPAAALALRPQGQHRRPAHVAGTARAASTAVSTPCSTATGHGSSACRTTTRWPSWPVGGCTRSTIGRAPWGGISRG